MTPAPSPIPPHLLERPFLARTANESGVSGTMLSGSRFVRLHHGVYAVAATRVDQPTHRNARLSANHTVTLDAHVERLAHDYVPLLRPGEAFSHTTALLLLGAPIRTDPELHVTVCLPFAAARGRNVLGHRTRTAFEPVAATTHQGALRCVPPDVALAQCGRILPFRELVVAIDHFICPRGSGAARSPILDISRFSDVLARSVQPGIARVRAACRIARAGAESRYETLTRFELARMGRDELELQVDLVDRHGEWIGRFDLADRRRRRIVEFDGEQHRTDRTQYLKDLVRLDRAREEGYRILRLHREDFAEHRLAATRDLLCEFLEVSPRRIAPDLARFFAEPLYARPSAPRRGKRHGRGAEYPAA